MSMIDQLVSLVMAQMTKKDDDTSGPYKPRQKPGAQPVGTKFVPKEPTFKDKAVTLGLRVVPPVAGGVVGLLGGPAGAAILGGGGAMLGEAGAQRYEVSHGLRENINDRQIATQGILGAVPVPGAAAAQAPVRLGLSGAEQVAKAAAPSTLRQLATSGAKMGAAGATATEMAETGELPPPYVPALGAAAGAVLGPAAGKAIEAVPGLAKGAARLVRRATDAIGEVVPHRVMSEVGEVGAKAPSQTVKAYKLFRVDPKQPGKLFPLFVDADKPVEVGKWLRAEAGPPAGGGKVKSKLGPLAYRPGWHAGDAPVATHIGQKSPGAKVPDSRPANHVWAEVEMPADVDWQSVATQRGTTPDGRVVPVKAHVTDQVPYGGHYRYKTNPNMTGDWLISGEMKVNRVLSDAEVDTINRARGVADLPRREPFDLAKHGFGSETGQIGEVGGQRTPFGPLMPMTGALVGGAAGATQGDTPGERARNALLGAGVGALGARGAARILPRLVDRAATLGADVAQDASRARLTAPRGGLPERPGIGLVTRENPLEAGLMAQRGEIGRKVRERPFDVIVDYGDGTTRTIQVKAEDSVQAVDRAWKDPEYGGLEVLEVVERSRLKGQQGEIGGGGKPRLTPNGARIERAPEAGPGPLTPPVPGGPEEMALNRMMERQPGLSAVADEATGMPQAERWPGGINPKPGDDTVRMMEDRTRIAAQGERLGLNPEQQAQRMEWYEQGDQFWRERRMGHSWDQMNKDAEDIVVRRMGLPKGTILNDSESQAFAKATAGWFDRTQSLGKLKIQMEAALKAGDDAGARKLVEDAGFTDFDRVRQAAGEALANTRLGIRSLISVRSEQGRALNAAKARVQLNESADEWRRTMEMARRGIRAGGTDEQIDKLIELSQLPDKDAAYRFMRQISQPGAQDYWQWYYYTNLLSAPLTQAKNALGNIWGFGVQGLGRQAGELVDVVSAKARGAQPTMQLGETLAGLKAYGGGMKRGLRAAGEIMKQGYTRQDAIQMTDRPPEIRFWSDAWSRVLNAVPRAMEAGDVLWRGGAQAAELYSLAYRAARQSGAKGDALAGKIAEILRDPPVEMLDAAGKMAARAVYRNEPSAISKAISTGVKGANRLQAKAVDKWFPVGPESGRIKRGVNFVGKAPLASFVVPFVSTPANITGRGLRMAVAPWGWQTGRQIMKAGDVTGGRVQQGEALVGAATVGILGALASAGVIEVTGADPRHMVRSDTGAENPAAGRDWAWAEERMPHAVKIGPWWISYKNLGPATLPMAAVGNVSDAAKRGDTPGQIASGFVPAMGRSVLSQNYLMGAMGVGQAFGELAGGGAQATSKANQLIGQTTASLAVPATALVRTGRNIVDPVVRDTDESRLDQSVIDNVLNQIPFASTLVPERVDYAGDVVKRPQGTVSRILQSTILPTEFRREQKDAVRAELARLHTYLSKPGKKWEGIDPTKTEQTRIARALGSVQYRAASTIMAMPGYSKLTDEQKAEVLSRIMSASRNAQRTKINADFGRFKVGDEWYVMKDGKPVPEKTLGGTERP